MAPLLGQPATWLPRALASPLAAGDSEAKPRWLTLRQCWFVVAAVALTALALLTQGLWLLPGAGPLANLWLFASVEPPLAQHPGCESGGNGGWAPQKQRPCSWPGLPLSPPLKVFMYELPREFNLDRLRLAERTGGGRDISVPGSLDQFSGTGNQVEWWLYRDLVLQDKSEGTGVTGSTGDSEGPMLPPDATRNDSPCSPTAVRVRKPAEADVFFVPAFTSYFSDIKHPRDTELQGELMVWLTKQGPWLESSGMDHVIPAQHPNALWSVANLTENPMLLVADLERKGSVLKDIVVPYAHPVPILNRKEELAHGWGQENRTTLLFFRGKRQRHGGGIIRETLFQILEKERDVVIEDGNSTMDGFRTSLIGFRTSQFCLNPAGDTPSSARLFDSIANLCVPVIVSDFIDLPFEDVIDYRKCALFVPTNKALKPGLLVSMLRNSTSQERLPQMREALRAIQHMFEWDAKDGAVAQVWRKVSTKLPHIKDQIHKRKRQVIGASN